MLLMWVFVLFCFLFANTELLGLQLVKRDLLEGFMWENKGDRSVQALQESRSICSNWLHYVDFINWGKNAVLVIGCRPFSSSGSIASLLLLALFRLCFYFSLKNSYHILCLLNMVITASLLLLHIFSVSFSYFPSPQSLSSDSYKRKYDWFSEVGQVSYARPLYRLLAIGCSSLMGCSWNRCSLLVLSLMIMVVESVE